MKLEELLCLLARPEGETLDFKQEDYDLAAAETRNGFIKDILSMANTPRNGDAYIVLGVRWSAEKGSVIIGLAAHRDDAAYQNALADKYVSPRPHFAYTPLTVGGLHVGVISVPCQSNGPFMPIGDFPNLQGGAIYFRRGSTNARAVGGKDQERIWTWFKDGSKDVLGQSSPPAWRDFLSEIGEFDPTIRYVLVADRIPPEETAPIETLSLVPWRAVIDLDPASEKTGLLSRIGDVVRQRRAIHRALTDDLLVHPEPGIHWYFASGLGPQGANTDPKSWRKQHKHALSCQLQALQATISPAPICVVVLWSNSPPALLRTLIEEMDGVFGDSSTLVVVSRDSSSLEQMCEEAGARYFDMSLRGLCTGIISVFAVDGMRSYESIQLPTSSGAPYTITSEDYPWLSEDLDIVHHAAGLQGEDSALPFRLGSLVSWRNLHLGHDCVRDVTGEIRHQVEEDLRRRETVRINLYHAPGGGGSTVGRRVLWELHDRYPAAVLNECDPRLTVDRIARISVLTESAVLILIDGGKHSERVIDELFERLKAQQIPVVLLQVLRRFSRQKTAKRQFWLPAELSDTEADRFRHALTAEAPAAASALARLASQSDRTRSPFFFGLTAFGRNFLALPSYVAVRLAHLTDGQQRTLAFISFAHHYGQQSLPAQAFAVLLGLSANRPVRLESMFQGPASVAIELLFGDAKGEWRTAHNEIAQEILRQILAPTANEDRESVWRQSLSAWAKEFADFIGADVPVVSERLLELARRVFVYRDNAELLGTERAATRRFSQLIEDIPSPQGRIDVLHYVSRKYPDEAHFHAHLGRLLGIEREYERALEEADRAVELSPDDHVLRHMRGMILRYQIRARFDAKDTLNDIIPLVAAAQRSFAEARDLRPDNEHSYVSEIQLLLDFLDKASQRQGIQNEDVVQTYVGNPQSPPFCRAALEQIEALIDRVSNLYVGEVPSTYITECRAKMQRFYGDYSAALVSFGNLLSRNDVARPPIRRQIVWTILRRHDGQWAKLSNKEVDRAQRLLEENLEEENRDSTSLRLWLRAIRLSRIPPSLDGVIERVAYWKLNTGSLDAVYYLYVLHCLRAMDGSMQAVADMERALEECRNIARYRRDRTRGIEWIGTGNGVAKLVHQSQLGEWQGDFWQAAGLLARIDGRVRSIDGPQKGTITITRGVDAFFVPAKADIHAGRDENAPVTCYVGFSYDGLRAWSVERC